MWDRVYSFSRYSLNFNLLTMYILKKEAEGKLKKVAKVAGMNKFLRMYYGIVKKRYKELNVWNA